MHRALLDPDGTPALYVPPDHPDFEVVLEGLRDLQQLGFVFEQLDAPRLPADFRERLRKVVGDVALPQDDLTLSHGRDAQCELYCAAILAKASLNPTFEEPDLRCTFEGTTFGVAVKRIKSYKSLRKRIGEAASQVCNAGLPGVIVAGVSVALNRDNERIGAPVSDEHFGAVADMVLTKVMDDHYKRLLDWTAGKRVHGIFFFDHHVRLHPVHGWGLDSQTFSTALSPYNQRRRREFRRLADHVGTGLATKRIPMRPKTGR